MTTMRTCSFCMTRMPLGELRQVADSLQCADNAACRQRARDKYLYPIAESEAAIGQREAAQGAVVRR